MSKKEAAPAQNSPPLETIEHVSASVKSQKKLLLAALAISAAAILSAVSAIIMSLGSGSQESAETDTLPQDTLARQLDSRIEGVSSRTEEVLAFTEQIRAELEKLSTQVGRIDVNDERNAIIRMQRLLIKQEQDFQAFIGSLESGMYNFQMMVPHSSGWWEEYTTELNAVNEKSKARESYATTLRDN